MRENDQGNRWCVRRHYRCRPAEGDFYRNCDFCRCLVEEAAEIRKTCGVVVGGSEQTAERGQDSEATRKAGIGRRCRW
uniref:Uncharacterized protein n=1 Tax=Picea sitchensis TaxID=3332 RepID=A9NTY1_PICSI|nr:unknown [Picea sitchensis]